MLEKIAMTAYLFTGASLPTALILALMKFYTAAGVAFIFAVAMTVLMFGIFLYKIWTDE